MGTQRNTQSPLQKYIFDVDDQNKKAEKEIFFNFVLFSYFLPKYFVEDCKY